MSVSSAASGLTHRTQFFLRGRYAGWQPRIYVWRLRIERNATHAAHGGHGCYLRRPESARRRRIHAHVHHLETSVRSASCAVEELGGSLRAAGVPADPATRLGAGGTEGIHPLGKSPVVRTTAR